MLPQYAEASEHVNPYCFMEALFRQLTEGEIVVTGDGTACVSAFQAAYIRAGQRLFHNSGCASMGYDLPAAIGAAFARPSQRIVCLAGDGSVMMNLQELQTIVGYRLPVKIFVLNNGGYHSIRQTQRNFFPDNIVGCGVESGLTFPDFGRVAAAFGLAHVRCERHADLAATHRSSVGHARSVRVRSAVGFESTVCAARQFKTPRRWPHGYAAARRHGAVFSAAKSCKATCSFR